ncbi:MAG: UGSC family (seleno)protein [Myxococcota bacterium]
MPSVSLVCSGFAGQAASTSTGLGFTDLAFAVLPGHVNMQSEEELAKNVVDVTAGEVIQGLTVAAEKEDDGTSEPEPRDTVFSGSFEAVNDYYYDQEWSDGLPIFPPTVEKVEAFLRFTDRDPDELLGVMLCDRREATIWNVAVNGVMAGCRPEYMPILIAIVEALNDPGYGLEHTGNTPGPETLIILNGPIIKELGFNYKQGAMRDGFRPNTSIGRFLRLYIRNVAGFLLHSTDKGTFGGTWRVVMAENEDALSKAGWETISVDMGFEAGENVVTLSRFSGGDTIGNAAGNTAERIMPYIADSVLRANLGWHLTFVAGMVVGTLRPLVVLSPLIASTIAKSGWTKADVRDYLFEHVRLPAHEFDKHLYQFLTGADAPTRTLEERVKLGEIPEIFCTSSDPNRLVPIVLSPDDFMVAVSGDPGRDNGYAFSDNGFIGAPAARKIDLPAQWNRMLDETKDETKKGR